jgi:hypothetical protein
MANIDDSMLGRINGSSNFLMIEYINGKLEHFITLIANQTRKPTLHQLTYELLIHYTEKCSSLELSKAFYDSFWLFCFTKTNFILYTETLELINRVLQSNEDIHRQEYLFYLGNYLEMQQRDAIFQETVKTRVNIEVLVGTASIMSSDGIPSAIVQHSLNQILIIIIGNNSILTRSCFKIVSFALELGLVHPLSVYDMTNPVYPSRLCNDDKFRSKYF